MAQRSYIHPLLDMESALESVFEATDTPLVALSRNGDLLLLNWRLQTITGFEPSRRLQSEFTTETMTPADREDLLSHLQRMIDGDAPETDNTRLTFRTQDGGKRTIAFTAIVMKDAAAQPMGVVYVGNSGPTRTHRRHDDQPSRDTPTATDRDENIASLVFSIDIATGQIGSMNQASAYLLGYSPSDFRSDPKLLSARVLPEYHEAFEASLADARRGVARSIEVGFARRNNDVVILALMLYPGRDEQGGVVSVEGIGRDITARKEAEQQLAESLWELQSAYDRLQAQHEELQSLERLKSQVLANVSHELRTPLVTIRGYNELMLQEEMGRINERQRKGLEISSKSIHRLLALIENLIDFARLEKDRLSMSTDRVDLGALLTEVVTMTADSMRQKQLKVKLGLPPEPLIMLGDRARLIQAFRNLVDNAEKFSDPSGTVGLAIHLENDEIHCAVTDNGIGIAADEQDKIFNTFYQVDGSSTRPYPGLGIGLAIVHEIVALHGGHIDVRSELGQGSTFVVVVPTAEARQRTVLGATTAPDDDMNDDMMADEVTTRAQPVVPFDDVKEHQPTGEYRVKSAEMTLKFRPDPSDRAPPDPEKDGK
jgi:PAS domain S-box-containing protein